MTFDKGLSAAKTWSGGRVTWVQLDVKKKQEEKVVGELLLNWERPHNKTCLILTTMGSVPFFIDQSDNDKPSK